MGREHTNPTRPGERALTDQVAQRQSRNEHLPRSCRTMRKPTGGGWESAGTDGNKKDRLPRTDPSSGREMPLNCTVEDSPIFPGPSLPLPSPDSPDTRAKWDQKDLSMQRWQIILSNHRRDEVLGLMPPGLAGDDFAAWVVRRAPAASPGQAGRWWLYFHFLLMFMT